MGGLKAYQRDVLQGYGARLVAHFKDHVRAMWGVEYLLTYADNLAIGFFKKQVRKENHGTGPIPAFPLSSNVPRFVLSTGLHIRNNARKIQMGRLHQRLRGRHAPAVQFFPEGQVSGYLSYLSCASEGTE